MNNKRNIYVIVFSLFTFAAIAQNVNHKSPFVSVNSGIIISSIENFKKTYESNRGFVFGLELGLPFSSRTYLYLKTQLFQKSGIPVISQYGYRDGKWQLISDVRNGTAEYTQWLLSGGIMVRFFPDPAWSYAIKGGLSYSIISEERKSGDGLISYKTDAMKAFGIFLGAEAEKNFTDSPFSVFLDIQQNYLISAFAFDKTNYGGFQINAGIRYYLKERRLE